MSKWDELSMAEKAEMMKVAVRQGITNLSDIKQRYNEFAEGGSKVGEEEGITDEQYLNTMEKVAEENYKNWGYNNSDEALVHALNDNTYDYRGYYNKYPQSRANADTHWTDEFKTVYHPTFSNESIYSSKKSQYNPYGLPGGFWVGEDENASFIPMAWQAINNQYKSGGGIHIKPSHRGRLTELKKRTGKTEAELYNDGNPAHKKMVVFARNARKWKHDLGGPLVYNPDEENIYGFGDWLEKSYNKAKSVVRKGRKIVKDLGLDKDPIQHFAEAIGIDSSKESMKNSNQSKNNNLGFWTTSALDAARAFGVNKKYKGKDTDTHYRQNLFNLVNPIDAVPSSVEDVLYYKKIADAAMSDKNYQYVREGKSDATADAAWAKRLGLPYDNTLLIDNSDGSVHLSEQLENEIPIDTIFLKDRIANNERLLNNIYGKNRQVISRALDFDKRALNSLRHTYKTGEKVEMNENSHNGRQWKQGNNVDYDVTPLSLLHRYTLQYDKDKNVMNYFDTYDFDEFEDFVPGSPFYIKGSINLNKRK